MSKPKSIISQSAEKISDNYSENPLTAILLTAISIAVPQVAIGKEAIDRAVTKIQKERFATLLDELAKGEKLLTPEIIESEEFIHSFVVIYRAAISTYQREKIRRFACILLTAIDEKELASDKFEEFTTIADELSERELELLLLLRSYEYQHPHEIRKVENIRGEVTREELENDFQRAHRFWSIFQKEVEGSMGFNPSMLEALLGRLNRTGLYQTFIGTYLGYSGGIGKTTSLFEEFLVWIKIEVDET